MVTAVKSVLALLCLTGLVALEHTGSEYPNTACEHDDDTCQLSAGSALVQKSIRKPGAGGQHAAANGLRKVTVEDEETHQPQTELSSNDTATSQPGGEMLVMATIGHAQSMLLQKSKSEVQESHWNPELSGLDPKRVALDNDLLGDALDPKPSGPQAHSLPEDSDSHHEVAVAFFFGVLAIGGVTLAILERYLPSLPYTVAMFIFGGLASLFHHHVARQAWYYNQSWFQSVELWSTISPHVLFFTFLPPLLFSDAMRLNVQLAKRCIYQVLILACPGVIFGAIMTAVVAKYAFPYGWDWPISLVFGSILSATDPVAVVALFNTLGVSPRLTMIIAGESLLNDGTAIVLFELTMKLLLGATLSVESVCGVLFYMVVPAIVVGFIVGHVFLFIIGICSDSRKPSDNMIQVTATICCAYLSFFIAEAVEASGVLSTVTAGTIIAFYAWPRFASVETVQIVWEAIEFIANTLIFSLAGVIFGDIVLDRWEFVSGIDFAYLILLYFLLTSIRAAMIAILWVPLNAAGTTFSWQEGAVMIHSGLRGAVSLALAIIVDHEPSVSKQMGTRLMFHVGGIAALTSLINATTAAKLLAWLGITKRSENLERMMEHCAKQAAHEAEEAFKRMKAEQQDLRYIGASEAIVRKMVPALAYQPMRVPLSPNLDTIDTRVNEKVKLQRAQMMREIFLRVVSHTYWEFLEKGVVARTSHILRMLMHSTSEALENTATHLEDWEAIKAGLHQADQGFSSKFMAALAECRPFSSNGYFRRNHSDEFQGLRTSVVTLCFMEAHARARRSMPEICVLHGAVDQEVHDEVLKESEQSSKLAADYLATIDASTVELAKSEMLSRRLLKLQIEKVDNLQNKGVLLATEAQTVEEEVKVSISDVMYSPPSDWLAQRGRR